MIILSICLSSSRLNLIHEVIKRILKGSQLPDEIWITYSEESHFLDSGVKTEDIQSLSYIDRIKLNKVPNYGPVRIYYPILETLWDKSNTSLILLDDDLGIREHTIEDLLYWQDKLDSCVTTAGHIVGRGKYFFKKTLWCHLLSEPEKVHIPFTGWATTFKVKDIHERILDWKEWDNNWYTNEPLLAYSLALQGTDRYVIPSRKIEIFDSESHLHETDMKNKNVLIKEFYKAITGDNAELNNEVIYETE